MIGGQLSRMLRRATPGYRPGLLLWGIAVSCFALGVAIAHSQSRGVPPRSGSTRAGSAFMRRGGGRVFVGWAIMPIC